MALASWFSINFDSAAYTNFQDLRDSADGWTYVGDNLNTIDIRDDTGVGTGQVARYRRTIPGINGVYEKSVSFRTADYQIELKALSAAIAAGGIIGFGMKNGTTTAWEVTLRGTGTIDLVITGGIPTSLSESVGTLKLYKITVNTAGSFEFFIDGISKYTTTITELSANKLFLTNATTGIGALVGVVDDIVAQVDVPTIVTLDFEPPTYTLTGGPGGTPELDTQDEWSQFLLTDPAGNMEITDTPSEVIGETQSLRMNVPGGFYTTAYSRIIPPTSNYTFSWVWDFPAALDGAVGMSMTLGKDDVNPFNPAIAWNVQLITNTGAFPTGQIIVVRPNFGSGPGFKNIDLSSPVFVTVRSFSDGTLIVVVNGEILRTGVAGQITVDRILVATGWDGPGASGVIILDDVVGISNVNLESLQSPQNVFAIRRKNYTLVFWDKVTKTADGAIFTGDLAHYTVRSSDLLNESDRVQRKLITTTDVNGDIDTVYLDLKPGDPRSYRVDAVAITGNNVVQSPLSLSATATIASSQIDAKEELIDRRIFILGESKLGEGLLV